MFNLCEAARYQMKSSALAVGFFACMRKIGRVIRLTFAAMNLKKLASWKWKAHFLCWFSL